MMMWLDNLDWPMLIIAGLFLAIAPMQPEPHLVEKLRMLSEGTLVKPIDIFDLLMHSAPLLLMAVKAFRQFVLKV
ncbi:hypothetical protein [Reinekea sp. G2M2-21]|uniref:hypothetical protein n=1 Tax=Reinekea sp. G2M2-21 TaxID=2788942 RepID=UPI001E617CFB|nr:hypothetical protein [Reinekea sp. G2M2-21]